MGRIHNSLCPSLSLNFFKRSIPPSHNSVPWWGSEGPTLGHPNFRAGLAEPVSSCLQAASFCFWHSPSLASLARDTLFPECVGGSRGIYFPILMCVIMRPAPLSLASLPFPITLLATRNGLLWEQPFQGLLGNSIKPWGKRELWFQWMPLQYRRWECAPSHTPGYADILSLESCLQIHTCFGRCQVTQWELL
jgi:hypothetical protein